MRLTEPVAEPPVDASWVSDREWGLVIDGRVVPSIAGRTFSKESPATESPICEIVDGDAQDVNAAVESSFSAFGQWRQSAVLERARLVRRMAEVLREHQVELATLDAVDAGNTYSLMRIDVEFGAQMMELMADAALQLQGATIPVTAENLHYTRREPFGVVGRITPFNHPVMFASQKIAAPLMAGNTVVLKPSETAPLSALRMGELFCDVLPPGVLNVVVGNGPDAGRALARHPLVRRVAFTGSDATGRAIQREAAEVGVKQVSLELGGKNAMIVCPDADVDRAVEGAIRGMNFYGWQSQSCGSTSRLLVHESLAEEMVEGIRERMAAIRVGSPLDPTTEMGPMANRRQYDRVLDYVRIGQEEGAVLVRGGRRPPDLDRGYYVEPTLFDRVTSDMRLGQEEVFGPLLSVMKWSRVADAVRVANGVEYGLTAAIWTKDIDRALVLAHEMEAGYVWVNGASTHFWGMPFGGYKNSGIDREESVEELLSYTQLKSVNVLLDRDAALGGP
jgi:2-formylbenzoate dehydrogenase